MVQSVLLLAVLAGICVWLLCRNRPESQESDPIGLSMIGLTGIANENISSRGSVSIRGELWNAACERGIILKGEAVRVIAVREELTLVVERVSKDG